MTDVALRWDERGVPYAAAFDDHYFCVDDGYEEAVHVCCRGNDLEARLQGLDPSSPGTFTVMETGFGTGLDFCCVRELWESAAPSSWQLHFISLERYPLSPSQLVRALAPWSQLSPYREQLADAYRPSSGGIGDIVWGGGRVRLTIVFDDVLTALGRIASLGLAPAGADAWSFDGFAPSRNPAMWSVEVFRAAAALSRPGTTFATFTAAGHVRRALAAAGFIARRVPALGRKRQMLVGRFSPSC